LHPSLPKRPTYDFAASADSIGLGAKPTAESRANLDTAAQALAGSNRDVVANRRAIRLANMSAAEVLKAELAGLSPVKPSANSKTASLPTALEPMNVDQQKDVDVIDDIPPGLSLHVERILSEDVQSSVMPPPSVPPPPVVPEEDGDVDAEGEPDPDSTMELPNDSVSQNVDDTMVDILAGAKRRFDEGPGEPEAVASEEDIVSIEEDDDDTDNVTSSLALKVNPDGTVEQKDIVK
jgi:5'-3' exoribonuclease 2